jgi:transposase
MATNNNNSALPDLDLSLLSVHTDDTATLKMMMLVEGTYGKGVKHSIGKYEYTEQRYYQILKEFRKEGSQALIDKKRGPRQATVRVESVVEQIIRLRFLDSEASAKVIAQKLKQTGYSISIRSVERTIQQYGLSKKNSTS